MKPKEFVQGEENFWRGCQSQTRRNLLIVKSILESLSIAVSSIVKKIHSQANKIACTLITS